MRDTPELLTPAQAAHRLALSDDRVRQLANAGVLACTRTPLGRLFRLEDVEALAEQRRQRAAAVPA